VDVGNRNVYFNELEMVDEEYIYANSFLSDDIYKFRVDNGTLVKIWNLAELSKTNKNHVIKKGGSGNYDWGNNVLNGIAFNKESRTFFLTGKRWDLMFEVQLNDD